MGIEIGILSTITVNKGEVMKCGVEHGGSGAIYGMGFIGAAVYFISHATGFWMGALGVLKAIVWPALLVYEALKFLGM